MSSSAPFPVAFNGTLDRFVVTAGNSSILPFFRSLIVITQDGRPFGHDVTGSTVGPGFAFDGSKVAYNGDVDRFVVTMGNRIIVITRDGRVYGHDVTGTTVGPGFAFSGSKVAYNGDVDRFVVTMGNRIIVITRDGRVYGHDVTGTTVGPGFAFSGSKVAYNGDVDRFVVTMGNRIIVITQDGRVYGHDISGTTVGPGFAFSGSKVAYNGIWDRFVVTTDNRIIVTTQDGSAYGHHISGTTVGTAFPMNFVLSHFTFANDISVANRNRTIERHRFALTRIAVCSNLSTQEKQKLYEAYDRVIHHTTNTVPDENASASVGGSQLNVNFGVLFPQGDAEISQTLIHEMMHCAGFDHPKRRDPPAGSSCASPDPAIFDCPGDNGVYFGTPPLRAEMCIAGNQSDMRARIKSKEAAESCVIDENGVAKIYPDAANVRIAP
ncbi:hypothetical protein ACFCWD_19060 [Streptomyces sp. NPDC056374]|uniref:hypothetical protein n=1 Tax=unclassified Streptomyces TaxID=2593676 RepID=UPI0035DEF4FD